MIELSLPRGWPGYKPHDNANGVPELSSCDGRALDGEMGMPGRRVPVQSVGVS